jgi:hypothetical protein
MHDTDGGILWFCFGFSFGWSVEGGGRGARAGGKKKELEKKKKGEGWPCFIGSVLPSTASCCIHISMLNMSLKWCGWIRRLEHEVSALVMNDTLSQSTFDINQNKHNGRHRRLSHYRKNVQSGRIFVVSFEGCRKRRCQLCAQLTCTVVRLFIDNKW